MVPPLRLSYPYSRPSLHVHQCLSESISAFFWLVAYPYVSLHLSPCLSTSHIAQLYTPPSTHQCLFPSPHKAQLYTPPSTTQCPSPCHHKSQLYAPPCTPQCPSPCPHKSQLYGLPCTPLSPFMSIHASLCALIKIPDWLRVRSGSIHAPRITDSSRASKYCIQYIVLKSTPGTSFRKIIGEFRTCRNKLSKEPTVMVVFKNI